MTRREKKEHVRRDVSEAFDFVRFLVKNPRALRSIKNGSSVEFLPAETHPKLRSLRMPKSVQTFATETIFHAV
jgi:hypothetical protein